MKKLLIIMLSLASLTLLAGCDLTGKTEQENVALKQQLSGLQEQISGLNSQISGLNTQIQELSGKNAEMQTISGNENLSGRKTYTNKKRGFTMQYPSDWTGEYIFEKDDRGDNGEICEYTHFTSPKGADLYFYYVPRKEKHISTCISGFPGGKAKKTTERNIGNVTFPIYTLVYEGISQNIYSFNPEKGKAVFIGDNVVEFGFSIEGEMSSENILNSPEITIAKNVIESFKISTTK